MTEAKSTEPVVAMSPRTARRPSGLGRGLGALLGDGPSSARAGGDAAPASDTPRPSGGPDIRNIGVAAIHPHPDQPRRRFEPGALDELATSIARHGVLQPIVVRPRAGGDGYELVAGERRWRAAQIAQIHTIPAIVRSLDAATTFELALIENIQRQDLNAMEEAQAYSRLMQEYGHTQDALGKIVGKSRSHVANLLRLLELPDAVQTHVREGRLSMGHARALVGSPMAGPLAERIIRDGLSVRQVEALARAEKAPSGRAAKAATKSQAKDADIAAVEQHLSDLLGLSVTIHYEGQGRGALTLGFRTLDQLDMLCQRLSGESI